MRPEFPHSSKQNTTQPRHRKIAGLFYVHVFKIKMKSFFLKLAFILILWLPFSLGALASIIVSLLAILFDKQTYGKNVLRAMDKTLAAVCGFSGYYTLSAECGVSKDPLWVCLSDLLDILEEDHCIGAARKEGLIK